MSKIPVFAKSKVEKFKLANGVTIIIDPDERFNTNSLGICLCGGLRGEKPELVGLTHFLEHLLFKRSKRHQAHEIAELIDELGGDVNAFTDDESLCLYGNVPKERFHSLADLLAELLLENDFNEIDLEREREVIRQEILDSQDDPIDVTHQNFAECFWEGNILSVPVFGTIASVENIDGKLIHERLRDLLVGNKIIIAAAGNVRSDEVVAIAEKYFGSLPPGGPERYIPPNPNCGVSLLSQNFSQIHFCLGFPWPPFPHKDYIPSVLLSSVIGEGMSSRLFQRVREEHGLLYDIGSSASTYVDTAALTISGAVERDKLSAVLELVLGELDKVRQDLILADELKRAISLATAQLEMDLDSVSARLWRAIETEQVFGRYISIRESIDKLQAVEMDMVEHTIQTWMGGKSSPSRSVLVLAGDIQSLTISDRMKDVCGHRFFEP